MWKKGTSYINVGCQNRQKCTWQPKIWRADTFKRVAGGPRSQAAFLLQSNFNYKNGFLRSHKFITSVLQSLIPENSIDFLFLYHPLWNCYQLWSESIIFFGQHFIFHLYSRFIDFFSASRIYVFRPLCLALSHNGEFLTRTSKLCVILSWETIRAV